MTYLDMPIPNRADHLWKYTPWSKIHPSDVSSINQIKSSTVKVDSEIIIPNDSRNLGQNEDISRVFLSEANNNMFVIEISDEHPKMVEVDGGDDSSIVHLHIICKSSSSITIKISGKCKWFGMYLTGEISPNSSLSIAMNNSLDDKTTMVRCEDWNLARDAHLEYGELSIGGDYVKSDIRTTLDGVNSSLRQSISVIAGNKRHDDHHIEILHKSSHTTSSLDVNSACSDKGHAIGTGLLIIEKDCDGSDSGQVFKNLLLSEQARAESIPELEVLSDDVSAAHGAASSSVDKEQLHYLMSRGFTNEHAEALIVEGFLVNSFSKLQNKDIREYLLSSLSGFLEHKLEA